MIDISERAMSWPSNIPVKFLLEKDNALQYWRLALSLTLDVLFDCAFQEYFMQPAQSGVINLALKSYTKLTLTV
jgi:hypothetical protein